MKTMAETISRSIFKAYDIRGIVDKTLTEEVCEKVGMALARWPKRKMFPTFVWAETAA